MEDRRLRLEKGLETYRSIGKEMLQHYQIGGRTLGEWREYFTLHLPDNPGPSELSQFLARLANHFQLAGHYLRVARVLHRTAQHEYEAAFAEEIKRLTESYEGSKRPARETLEEMAEAACLELKAALVMAEIAERFWDGVTWSLRQQMEVAGHMRWLLAAEAKVLTT